MAVEAQLCSENMGFPLFGSQDRPMTSVLGLGNGVSFQGSSTQPTIGSYHLASQFLGPKINQYPSGSSSMDSSQILASQRERQRAEMDFYLHFQSERLMRVLHEETRQQAAALLQRYESKLLSIVQKQDLDLAIAREKCVELQNCVVWADNEAKAWQKRAVESEALVQDLEKRLSQIRDCNELAAQDAESTCESSSSSRSRRGNRACGKKMIMDCNYCHVESACVLFLPCRHLCSCKSCEALFGFCPVCKSVKEGSMEVFLV